MIKVMKVFFSDLDNQEVWLNEKASQGLRLVKSTRLFYYFEECKPGEYVYKVEYVYDKSFKNLEKYIDFLKELNIRAIKKNFSMGVFAHHKVSVSITGQVRTTSRNINAEILILEKKNDGKPFEIYTTKSDKIDYYKKVKRLNLSTMIFMSIIMIAMLVLVIGEVINSGFSLEQDTMYVIGFFSRIGVSILSLAIMIPCYLSLIKISKRLTVLKKLNEN
ncbi:DUF2812 domain-containing protein [Mobilitalea sibirica]|uniref:DUF2812 domain-containing protein n=1 Tax=Mobilitalea sibirica TaxID=1462919 RepID=A0A8J7KVA9_9FIRM|nr:DUF2812 domain-containing protein [Mobilitalea sibirica]MBH1939940.1 DUF2812 domain-containing protein [Mobilitalea sibirica]